MSDGLSRRQLLGRLGAGAGVAALAGCPGGDGTRTPPGPEPEETPTGSEPPPVETDTPSGPEVVDLREAGADPNGEESILPVLRSVQTGDVVLQFPPGEYFMDDVWRVRTFENVTIEGPEATIRPARGLHGPLFGMGSRDGATGLTIAGLTFDLRADDTGPRPIYGMVSDGLHVADVDVAGRMDLDQDGMRFDVVDPDGRGVVRNLSMPDGGTTDHPITGVFVGEAHRGTLAFESCHVAGFPDNGLYASPARGRVDVVGGRYENNGIANVRVSGPATVRDVAVRCDRADRNLPNMRGIRLRGGRDVLVRNCDIEMAAVTGSDGAITCAPHLEEATIRDTTVTVGVDEVAAMWAKRPDDAYDPSREHPITIRGLEVAGDAGLGATVMIDARPNPMLEDVSICQPGEGRDGIRLIDAGRTILNGSRVAVTGDPIVNRGAEVESDGSTLRRLDPDENC